MFTIYFMHDILTGLDFKSDPVNIKAYIKRIPDNDVRTFASLIYEKVSQNTYYLLRDCPPSPITVGRSFSMLKKLLNKEGNFDQIGIFDYICCYFNSKLKN